eukprot:GHVU01174951.1.p1 GENE.GHVU01174951.1~~GHVU01174951.1.p1  ORF type:complete len:213 (+),score=44.66 GHVU01174951.1:38-640(+)
MRKAGEKKWKVVSKEPQEPKFTVPGLKEETDYEFRVTAENKAGQGPPSDPSDTAKFVESANWLRPLEDITLKDVGLKAVFECEISKENVKSTWAKAGKTIKAGDNYTIEDETTVHRLTINKAVGEDEGKYSVTIAEASCSATLKIQAPPKFLEEKYQETIYIRQGTAMALELPFSANPMPKVTWKFNGGALPDKKRFKTD